MNKQEFIEIFSNALKKISQTSIECSNNLSVLPCPLSGPLLLPMIKTTMRTVSNEVIVPWISPKVMISNPEDQRFTVLFSPPLDTQTGYEQYSTNHNVIISEEELWHINTNNNASSVVFDHSESSINIEQYSL